MAVTIRSASSSRAGGERDPVLGEASRCVGDDRGVAAADRLEEVAVGHEAEALVPGVVASG